VVSSYNSFANVKQNISLGFQNFKSLGCLVEKMISKNADVENVGDQ
jgi:hypothetical protein